MKGALDVQELSDMPDLIALSLVPRMVVCLAHSDALEALNSPLQDRLGIDGTFWCERGFQIVVVWGFMQPTDLSPTILAVGLLDSKETDSYVEFFRALAGRCPNLSPSVLSADFERAIREAIALVWPDATFEGCGFHWMQAQVAKMKELGIRGENLRGLIALVRSLSRSDTLLDLCTNEEALLRKLVSLHGSPFREYTKYIETNWLGSPTKPARVSPKEEWVMCYRRVTGPVRPQIHFTNCAAEIINSRMNKWLRENDVPRKVGPSLLRALHRHMVICHVRASSIGKSMSLCGRKRRGFESTASAHATATRRRLLETSGATAEGIHVADAGSSLDGGAPVSPGVFVGNVSTWAPGGSKTGSVSVSASGSGSGSSAVLHTGSNSGSDSMCSAVSCADSRASGHAVEDTRGVAVALAVTDDRSLYGSVLKDTRAVGVAVPVPSSSCNSGSLSVPSASGTYLGKAHPSSHRARQLKDIAESNKVARCKPSFTPHRPLAAGTTEVEFLRSRAPRSSSTNPPIALCSPGQVSLADARSYVARHSKVEPWRVAFVRTFSAEGGVTELQNQPLLGQFLADLGVRNGGSILYTVAKKKSNRRRVGLHISVDGREPVPSVAFEDTPVADLIQQFWRQGVTDGAAELECHHVEDAKGHTLRVSLKPEDSSTSLLDLGAQDGSTVHMRGLSANARADRIARAVAVLSHYQTSSSDQSALRSDVELRYLGETHGVSVGVRSLDQEGRHSKVRSLLGGEEGQCLSRVLRAPSDAGSLAAAVTQSDLRRFVSVVSENQIENDVPNAGNVATQVSRILHGCAGRFQRSD